MKRLIAFVLPALLLLAGLGLSGVMAQGTPEATPEPPPDPTIYVRLDPALGPIFTDRAGMTLYLFSNDTTPGESTCYDQCAVNWPPFTADEPLVLPNGVDGELTTISRTDGTTQVAYNGIPLYYWINDTQPGETTGQGVGDVWWVVAPGQTTVAVASPAAGSGMVPVATPAAAGEVTVTLTEFTIGASQTEFKVGETYTFVVTNAGQFPHEFYIERAGSSGEPLELNGVEAEIEPMESGQSGTLTVAFTEAGIYQFACHIRMHYPQGMALTIVVTE